MTEKLQVYKIFDIYFVNIEIVLCRGFYKNEAFSIIHCWAFLEVASVSHVDGIRYPKYLYDFGHPKSLNIGGTVNFPGRSFASF